MVLKKAGSLIVKESGFILFGGAKIRVTIPFC